MAQEGNGIINLQFVTRAECNMVLLVEFVEKKRFEIVGDVGLIRVGVEFECRLSTSQKIWERMNGKHCKYSQVVNGFCDR